MKKISWILAISVFILSASCNSEKEPNKAESKKDDTLSADMVPAAVKTSFSAKFPTATEVVWETAHEGDKDTYKSHFNLEGKKWKAEYTADGTLIKDKEDEK